jgi:hypothetical protein
MYVLLSVLVGGVMYDERLCDERCGIGFAFCFKLV